MGTQISVGYHDLLATMARDLAIAYDVQTAALATATLAAPAAGSRNRIIKADASYSSPSQSGTLTITMGSTSIVKDIHGSGAVDFPEIGFPSSATAQAITAALSAGGAGIIGHVFISGFACPE